MYRNKNLYTYSLLLILVLESVFFHLLKNVAGFFGYSWRIKIMTLVKCKTDAANKNRITSKNHFFVTFLFLTATVLTSAFEHALKLLKFLWVDEMFGYFISRCSFLASTSFEYALNVLNFLWIDVSIGEMSFFPFPCFLSSLLVLLFQTQLSTLDAPTLVIVIYLIKRHHTWHCRARSSLSSSFRCFANSSRLLRGDPFLSSSHFDLISDMEPKLTELSGPK